MIRTAPDSTEAHEALGAAGELSRRILGSLLGIGFTFVLFYGLSHVQHLSEPTAVETPPEIEDNTLYEVPPPLPQKERPQEDLEAIPMASVEWAYSRSDSAVKIEATPPLLDRPELEAPPPTAFIQTNNGNIAVKPAVLLEDVDLNRVYDMKDVDTPAREIKKYIPRPSRFMVQQMTESRFRVHLVVDKTGHVTAVKVLVSTGYDKLDQFLVKAIKDWEFQPAVRKGKKVNSAFLQTLYLKESEDFKLR